MGAIFTRRNILALLSGIALIAIVALSVRALSAHSPLARTTTARSARAVSYRVTVTPGATSTSSAQTSHSSPVGAGLATPTPPASRSGGDIAWPVPGDYAAVIGSYSVITSNATYVTPHIQMLNAGTTTWLGDWSYYLGCVSNCMNGSKVPTGGQTSGQAITFGLQLQQPLTTLANATYYSQWAMFHSPSPGAPGVQFGEIATVKIVVTVSTLLGVDPAPGCDTSDITWTVAGGVCATDGLELTTNAAQEPTVALQSAPKGFDNTNYQITINASFAGASGAWVRITGYDAGTSQCAGQAVDVQADGTERPVVISNCTETPDSWSPWTITSGPVVLTFRILNGNWLFLIDGHGTLFEGTFAAGVDPVITVGGPDGAVVTLTNGELDAAVPYTTQTMTLQNGRQRG
jgi:hypothetical protein